MTDHRTRELERLWHRTGDFNIAGELINYVYRSGQATGQETGVQNIAEQYGIPLQEAWDVIRGHPVGFTREIQVAITGELDVLGVTWLGQDEGDRTLPTTSIQDASLAREGPPHLTNYFKAYWDYLDVPADRPFFEPIVGSTLVFDDEPGISWKDKPLMWLAYVRNSGGRYSGSGPTASVVVKGPQDVSEGIHQLVMIAERLREEGGWKVRDVNLGAVWENIDGIWKVVYDD